MIHRAIVGAVIAGCAFGTGLFVGSAPDDPARITGTYDVPTGTLTTYGDRSARYDPFPLRWPVAEDDPGWDCATMGNRICGSVRP